MSTRKLTTDDVLRIAKLANIPITKEEAETLKIGFEKTLQVIEQLNSLQTENIEPTHQVTGLVNVMREDMVDETRMLSQAAALSNAKNTHEGYFVVDQILETESSS